MAQSFDLATDLVVNNSAITGNGKFVIWHSDAQTNPAHNNLNTNGDIKFNTLFLEIEYSNLLPNIGFLDAGPQLFIETRAAGSPHWISMTAQAQRLTSIDQGAKQTFLISPNLIDNTFGGTNDISDGNVTLVKQHTRNGILMDEWRACLAVNERNFGTENAFVGVTISVGGFQSNT